MDAVHKDLQVAGIRLASAAAGIRYRDRDDLVLIELAEHAVTAAVFTQNAFCAAPVIVAKEHLAAASPRYLLINSGNANAGTGAAGLSAARETCKQVAAAAGCAMNQVLPFSTGVIGEDLPTEPFSRVMLHLMSGLAEDGWASAASAILTTDTRPKLVGRHLEISGHPIRMTGMAKGSGMICPNMATMLAYVATDARLQPELLDKVLRAAVADSFNSITVDGDTSTNDACILIASGQSDLVIDDLETSEGQQFLTAVKEVCLELALAIVEDGEGATKQVEISVEQARDREEARAVAYTVAQSPLVKTALFASDPNWGRILAAVGRSGVKGFEIGLVRIYLGDVCIVSQGGRDADYTELAGQEVMKAAEIKIRILLGRGDAETRVHTCDLSYDYIKINAEYRT